MEARIARERLLETLSELPSETAVRDRVAAVNDQIQKAHFSHIAGPADGVLPLAEEEVLILWRNSRQ
jgi:hypothetical protein